jgi:hypothetical protein
MIAQVHHHENEYDQAGAKTRLSYGSIGEQGGFGRYGLNPLLYLCSQTLRNGLTTGFPKPKTGRITMALHLSIMPPSVEDRAMTRNRVGVPDSGKSRFLAGLQRFWDERSVNGSMAA